MATTTNFGWSTPDDSDLVKDGALAIRTLGSAIDTSLVDLKGGTTGQVLSKNSNTDMDFTWVTSDDADAIQNSIVDAKGDLISATADNTPARLAVGNNGETLVADSSATTGLRYNPPVASLDNPIINGGFDVWQRGTSFTSTGYTADRWNGVISAGTCTFSRSTDAPSNFTYSLSMASVNGTNPQIQNRIESLNSTPFAGKTVTVSFWAKSTSGSNQLFLYTSYPDTTDNFASQTQDLNQGFTITSSWVRYSHTFTVNALATRGYQIVLYRGDTTQSSTTLITGVQMDLGTWTASTAPTFRRAGGTLAGELQAAQRYYYRAVTPENAYGAFGTAMGRTGTTAYGLIPFPVPMRTTPTSIEYSTVRIDDGSASTGSATAISINSLFTSRNLGALDMTFSTGVTQYRPYVIEANNSTAAYVAFSAEL